LLKVLEGKNFIFQFLKGKKKREIFLVTILGGYGQGENYVKLEHILLF